MTNFVFIFESLINLHWVLIYGIGNGSYLVFSPKSFQCSSAIYFIKKVSPFDHIIEISSLLCIIFLYIVGSLTGLLFYLSIYL